jgi:hypothetical protein
MVVGRPGYLQKEAFEEQRNGSVLFSKRRFR